VFRGRIKRGIVLAAQILDTALQIVGSASWAAYMLQKLVSPPVSGSMIA